MSRGHRVEIISLFYPQFTGWNSRLRPSGLSPELRGQVEIRTRGIAN